MIHLDNKKWPSSPLKQKNLDAEQLKQFLTIRADYEKSAFVTEGHFEVRALGAKDFTRPIPPGESGITALCRHSSGHIYGGTGGTAAHLFFYNPAPDADAAADIGTVPGAERVVSLAELPSGAVFGAAVTPEKKSLFFIYKPCQVLLREKDFTGMGVREIFDLPAEDQLFFSTIDPCHSSGTIEMIDCPIEGEILDMVLSPDGSCAYCLTAGIGEIFRYELESQSARQVGRLDPNGNFSPKLGMDGCGKLYGAGLYGRIFRYDPIFDDFSPLAVCAPAFKGQEVYARVTAWCPGREGKILYGGTESGLFFRFDTETEQLLTLGKPCAQSRISAMTRSAGKIFMVAGEPDDCAHLGCYDDATRELRDLGCPLARSERPWNGYRFEAMVTGRNGVVFLGEYDRISQLFMYFPKTEE